MPSRAACTLLAATGSLGIAVTFAAAPVGGSPVGVSAAEGATATAAKKRARSCPPGSPNARSGVARRISIRCAIPNRAAARAANRVGARIVRRPRRGGILGINQRRDWVRYRSRPAFSGRDRFVVVRRGGGRRWRMVVRVDVRPPPGPPLRCERVSLDANYQRPVEVAVTCTGDGLEPLEVASGPFHGTLDEVEESGDGETRTLTATYLPDDLHVGDDVFLVDARDRSGRIHGAAAIEVRPWRMRAIGDSVTAGFGYFGDGSEMTPLEFDDCIPPDPVNNRCSSNSDQRDGYGGPPSWSADFGLGNDVSWAAQFANGWQGGGHITAPVMFQNRAVTGSAPSDWLPGGVLADQLDAIVAANPDFIPMTMGANPLLSDILESEDGEACALTSDVAELIACIEPFFTDAELTERLQELYTALLEAPDAQVVVLPYHLTVPSANLFSVWQIEAMIDYLNAQIATAVASTEADVAPASAARLTLIEPQVEPAGPDPQKLPRFNVGLPPDEHQSWTASYDCGELFEDLVDGPSHQSEPTQDELEFEHPLGFCSGTEWIIDADSGIHPNAAGYQQFATTLANVAQAGDLVPTLP